MGFLRLQIGNDKRKMFFHVKRFRMFLVVTVDLEVNIRCRLDAHGTFHFIHVFSCLINELSVFLLVLGAL